MRRSFHPLCCACAVFAMLSLSPSALFAQTTAFVGARVIDGRGKVIENATIVVRDGKIAAVGPAASTTVPAGAERIDLKGSTIMPGIVNAHGHLTGANGMRNDPNGYTRENLIRQLNTYGSYGVTTVFSLGDDQEAAFQLRNEQGAGPLQRSRFFIAGPVINGANAEAARAMTDKVAAMKPDLLKIRVDDNLGTSKKMPEEAWRATIARAKELELPLDVHVFYLADAKATLMAGASVVAHSVRDVPVDAEFLQELKSRRACYIPTLTREVSTYVYASTPPWVSDPFFLKGAGDAVGKELSDPARQSQFQSTPGYKLGLQYKAALDGVAKPNLKKVSDAGVLVAMGTDTGPAGRWQGFFEHLEMEMMVQSGMTPMQVITASTSAAAECHGKGGQFGVIAPGASADLLVLSANPLDDIRNTRKIQSIWLTGKKLQ